jgi:PilZ domain-containing protein
MQPSDVLIHVDSWSGKERRGDRRRDFIGHIDCSGGNILCLCRSLNLGGEGLLMGTLIPWKVGTELKIRFEIPVLRETLTIRTKGIVLRVNPDNSIAIQFTELLDSDREAIQRFLGTGGR